MKIIKFVKAAASSAIVVLSPLVANAAFASDYGSTQGNSGVVYGYAVVAGFDRVDKATEGYVGSIFAFNRDLDRDGLLFRSISTYGFYKEVGNYVAGVDDRFWQGDAMIGYQFVRNGVTVAGYAGIDYQRHKLSPDDTSVKLRGSETGFKAVVEIETERNSQRGVYLAAEGAYSTAFDNYYALGRVGLNMGRIAIGPEGMFLGDESGDARRLGGFILSSLSLGETTAGTVSASVGYQFVDNANSTVGSNFGEEGVYATLQFTMAFGRVEHGAYK